MSVPLGFLHATTHWAKTALINVVPTSFQQQNIYVMKLNQHGKLIGFEKK
jgi:hypothetical protein